MLEISGEQMSQNSLYNKLFIVKTNSQLTAEEMTQYNVRNHCTKKEKGLGLIISVYLIKIQFLLH